MKKIILNIVLLTLFQQGFSQKKDENIGDEVVNIVKPYTPTISDAFKVKETPSLDKEIAEPKLPILYQIFSFPVASTFVPSKGKAAAVDQTQFEKGFTNYALLGGGNYGTLNAEVFVTQQLNRTNYVGALVRHLSSQGNIKNTPLDSNFGTTSFDGTYGNRTRNGQWNIDLGVKNQIINWYGLPLQTAIFTDEMIAAIQPKQSYTSLTLAGRMEAKDGLLSSGQFQFKRFSDKFGSGENRFYVKPQIDVTLFDQKIKADFVLDYVGGSFEKNALTSQAIKYNTLIFGTKPSFMYKQEDLSIQIGAGVFYASQTNDSQKEGKLFVYPNIKASYRLVGDLMIAYAGAEGNLHQNSYADYVSLNPFVSPTLFIAPTDQSYDLYVGMKGKLANSVSFNVRGAMINEKNKPLFTSNTFNFYSNPSPYAYSNSFQVIYDDIKTLSLFGELKADFSKTTSFAIQGTFFNYTTSKAAYAWNLPTLKLGTSFETEFTDKWYAGLQLFFVGERKDLISTQSLLAIFPPQFSQEVQTLDSYFDLNAHVGYKYNKRLTAFLKGNNLANQAYQSWANFPVQGIQVVLGASYKFDF